MINYENLKCRINPYQQFQLAHNPFSIAPLFKEFKKTSDCQKEENLFVFPLDQNEEAKILLSGYNQRILVYGLYGVGKTSFVDFILYLAYNFHKRFATRVVIAQDNLEKAIHEILVSLCFDVISEIDRKSLFHPLIAIRKWITGERHMDTLMGYLQKLLGKYTETSEKIEKKATHKKIGGNIPILKGELSYEAEMETRRSLQTYVETLTLRQIAEYLSDILKIVRFLGFDDIIVFVDEADHIQDVQAFLKLLTRSREVLFTSGYTFFIAGSLQLAKYTEAMGAIFDKLLFLKPATFESLKIILNQRIQAINPKLTTNDIFNEEVLEEIFNRSKGVRKQALRLSEQALEKAAIENCAKVKEKHLMQVLQTSYDEVALELSLSQSKLLNCLANDGSMSPSDSTLQKKLKLKRTQLRDLLEDLWKKGYVHKEKKGRTCLYTISAQYKPYFASSQI